MEQARLTPGGRITIPRALLQGLSRGTVFHVVRQDDTLVLKKVAALSKREESESKELELIWKDIDEGRGLTMEIQDFRLEMESW